MKISTALVSAAALTLALSASPPAEQAAAARRPRRPRASRSRSRQTFTLDNGLAVTLVPYGTVPKVTVRLAVLRRQRQRGPQPGLARRPDGRHALRRHGDPDRLADRRGRGEDGRLARRHRRREPHRDRRRRSLGVRPDHGRPRRRRRACIPKFPESELARLKADRLRQLSIARSQPQPLAQEKFRAVLYGDHPYGRLFPTEAMLQALHARAGARASTTRTTAPRARTSTSSATSTTRRSRPAIRKAFAGWKKGTAPELTAAIPEERARRLHRRPARRRAVHDQPRHARHRPVAARLGHALPDERPARRLLLLAHHLEHPRAEGVHVLPVGPALRRATATRTGSRPPTSRRTSRGRRSRRSSARSTASRPRRRRSRS